MTTYNYQRALVSFVDILGFKNLISTETVEEILNILHGKDTLSLQRWFRRRPDGGEQEYVDTSNTTTFSFSDLIVNVTPLEAEPPLHLHLIFEQIRVLGFRQFYLAASGIFVRGGITVGDIYVESQTIFGPALVKAYELESMSAKWPIIAVDPEMLRDIQRQAPAYLQSREDREGRDGRFCGIVFLNYLSEIIGTTDDGTPFLDYIACLAYEDQTTGDLRYFLEDHKKSVVDAQSKYRHWKYEFIGKYHDSKCKQYFPESGDLLVGTLD